MAISSIASCGQTTPNEVSPNSNNSCGRKNDVVEAVVGVGGASIACFFGHGYVLDRGRVIWLSLLWEQVRDTGKQIVEAIDTLREEASQHYSKENPR